MLNYFDTKNVLFTRGISFSIEQYLFVAQVVLGEDKATAYAMVYDRENFARETGTEEEQDYIAKFERDADIMLQQQECQHLKELLEENLQLDIQNAASTLKDYKFSGADVQQLLANLLHNRVGDSESLDDASVKDVISLIKMMYEQGALDSGDSFQKHFITIMPKFNALCTECNHEFDVVAGVDCICPHCHKVYKWAESEHRFYPAVSRL